MPALFKAHLTSGVQALMLCVEGWSTLSRQFSSKWHEIHSWITVSLDTYIHGAYRETLFSFDRWFFFHNVALRDFVD